MYTLNNPHRYVDNNGKWPTGIHNQIIERAFPGLSQQQRGSLKATSRNVDRPSGQTKAHNPAHAMRSPGTDPAAGRQAIDSLIDDVRKAAQKAQGGTPSSVDKIKPAALDEFGKVLHAVTDRTSPAHTDQDGNPREWSGIPTSPGEIKAALDHNAEEATITDDQMKTAVGAAQEAFRQTFGPDAYHRAIGQPRQEEREREREER